jgi:hypothetical protein
MAYRADLVKALRDTARWRKAKAMQFANDETAQRRSHRAMVAIQIAAKFVDAMPDDDSDIRWLMHVDVDQYGRAALCQESRELLSRFGMNLGAWTDGPPGEHQVRNLLRRLDGAEARARAAVRRNAQ